MLVLVAFCWISNLRMLGFETRGLAAIGSYWQLRMTYMAATLHLFCAKCERVHELESPLLSNKY